MAQLSGSDPSSRRWGFQPLSRPRMMSKIAADCTIIMTWANSEDRTVSITTPENKPQTPPKPRRRSPLKSEVIKPNSFGSRSRARVQNSRLMARSLSCIGQVGNSV